MAHPLVAAQLPHTLRQTAFPSLGERYQGKVRDTYRKGDRLVLVTTDRLSAFDHVLTTVPFKGEVLNRLASFWFEKTAHVVKNHVLDVPDPNVTVARRCEPLPVEWVVRGYLTGSLYRDLQSGAKAPYGLTFDPAMKKDEAFPTPLLTPSTKAALGTHDEPVSEEELVSRNLVSRQELSCAKEVALSLFAEGQRWARSRGLLLVDSKYELGKLDGELVLIDELHTPDSSRFWLADEYAARLARGEDQQMLDKENIRQWLIRERGFAGHGTPPEIPDEVRAELAEKYLAAYERITGSPLALNVAEVAPRIEENLRAKGYL